MATYFILWVGIQYYHYIWFCSNSSNHDHCELSDQLHYSLDIPPPFFLFLLSTSLCSGITKCFRLIYSAFLCPNPGFNHFFKGSNFKELFLSIKLSKIDAIQEECIYINSYGSWTRQFCSLQWKQKIFDWLYPYRKLQISKWLPMLLNIS